MTSHSNSPHDQDSKEQAGPGPELVVDVGPIAHGGHFIARHEGRVIFVRHGIPGEKVRIRLTD
ncbi:TRAM domain-containing protein, partial [Paenarthrobacter sp. RAF9]